MGFWAIYFDISPWPLRKFRLLVILVALLSLGTFVFLKQFLLDRELIRLLDDSNNSFENLQRLQTQVVQQEKLASLGQLVSGAAHEINNPLTAILGYSELLSSQATLDESQRSMVVKIRQQARRTRDLVADLLRFAQQAPAEKSPLDLSMLLQRVVHTQMIKVEGKKIEIKFVTEPNLPRVMGNANQLFTACLQIVDNAIDAIEEDGGGKLVVSLTRDGDSLFIKFLDSGPGLRDPKTSFRSFLYDQADREGYRPRSQRHLRCCPGSRRSDFLLQQPRSAALVSRSASCTASHDGCRNQRLALGCTPTSAVYHNS